MSDEQKPDAAKALLALKSHGRDLLGVLAGVVITILLPALSSMGGGVLDSLAERIVARLIASPAWPKVVPAAPAPAAPAPAAPAPAAPAPAAPAPAAPAPAPAPKKDTISAKDAAVRIQAGRKGCSGTLFRLDDSDQYWLLTCAHCVASQGELVNVDTGRGQLTGRVVRFDQRIDICLVKIDQRGRDYPVAKIADAVPGLGAQLFHKGFGVDRPGNVETGYMLKPGGPSSPSWYSTRLSSGDSGSGQFNAATGELVAIGSWAGSNGENGGASLWQIRAFLGLTPPAGGDTSPSPAPFPSPSPGGSCPPGGCRPPGWRNMPIELPGDPLATVAKNDLTRFAR